MWQMFYYINQSSAPSFLIRLVKLNLTLLLHQLNAGNSCDQCCYLSSFGFLRPRLSPLGYRNRCFLVVLCRLEVTRLNLDVATKRVLYQHVKITGQFQCHFAHKSVSCSYFQRWGYFQDPWVSFVMADEFAVRVTKDWRLMK